MLQKLTTKAIRMLASLVLALAATSTVCAEENMSIDADLNGLLKQVSGIITVGHWRHNDLQGNYRIIAMHANEDGTGARLYIQWISTPNSSEDYHVYATVSVDDIDALGMKRFTMPSFTVDTQGRNILEVQRATVEPQASGNVRMQLFQHPGYAILSSLDTKSPSKKSVPERRHSRALEVLENIPVNILNYRWPSF